MNRIKSIDALRGFVMVIMLIDHVRETFFLHLQVSDPVDVLVTSPNLFYTRFITAICAPVFIWLAFFILCFILYFPTKWFAKYKQNNRQIKWLKYF